MRSIKWEDFVKLQTNKIENKNFEIENLLSNVEDTFINTAGKAPKANAHKANKAKNRKSKNRNSLAKLVMRNIKSWK